ncbi:MAG: RnfABCDGE type electron transport complex subunit C [Spirochaetaceae bacterium]|nr:MAG: RnfABCDGE type electron transport complex subunit C [Spirochaetaceae bacterium]
MSLSYASGIRPLREQKKLERGFWNAAVPSTCIVPLQQHVGSKLAPLVQQGDVVREGMIIADGPGRFAVPLHAPIPGRVSTVGTTRLFDNTTSLAIMIELAGEFDRLGKEPERLDWSTRNPDELREMVRRGGVVATGRAPLPLHSYLRRGQGGVPPLLVLDLAETEPYLTADTELTSTYPDAVLEGLRIIARILSTTETRVLYSPGNRSALTALRRGMDRTVRIHRVPHRYPANLEQRIRRVVLPTRERDDPARRVITVRPSTAHAVYEAVVLGKPQIEQVIAVGGGAVARPAHIRIRLGTSVADVISECGGLLANPARLVAGGPLTGSEVFNVHAPLPKHVTAVLALTESEIGTAPEHPCIRCGACVRACPVGINPVLIHDLVAAGRAGEARRAGRSDCVECGLCSHVCPSRIPLVERIREVDGE